MSALRFEQPLLGEACTLAWLEQGARYPLDLSLKYDGIRALVRPKGLLSRKLKPIKNMQLRQRYSHSRFLWLDGELVEGKPTDPLCYTKTADVVNERLADARHVRFYVFDYLHPDLLGMTYDARYRALRQRVLQLRDPTLWLVRQTRCRSPEHVEQLETHAVEQGYEGVMLRDPLAPHKNGRSTVREGILLKLKRSEDSEALVLKVYPRQRNTNEQKRDERGYAKRSSAKAGKVPTKLLGGFRVRDLKTRKEFDCGTGNLKRPQLKLAGWVGTIIKYRFQPAGVKDLPRYPRCVGRRDRGDL